MHARIFNEKNIYLWHSVSYVERIDSSVGSNFMQHGQKILVSLVKRFFFLISKKTVCDERTTELDNCEDKHDFKSIETIWKYNKRDYCPEQKWIIVARQ